MNSETEGGVLTHNGCFLSELWDHITSEWPSRPASFRMSWARAGLVRAIERCVR